LKSAPHLYGSVVMALVAMALVDFAIAKDMDIDSNSYRDNSYRDNSYRDIHIDIEDILGTLDIPDTMSDLLADL